MSATASLPAHVVFRELPFCGVLLDTDRSRVYRLSQEASHVLREALDGRDAPGPYDRLIAAPEPASSDEQRERLLSGLRAQGLVLLRPGGDDDG